MTTKFATSAVRRRDDILVRVTGEPQARRFGPQWSLAQIIETLNAEGIDCRAFDRRKPT